MTLFKKNFSYKRGWQFANKLKLSTLFFGTLISLIAGATSVSAQGVSSEGWDYYPDMGIVAKLDYEGEVACASKGYGCLQVNSISEIVFADLTPLKCGSMHAGIYGSPGYGSEYHWCESLDRIKRSAVLNINPKEWNRYPNLGGIIANLNYDGEVACASYNGERCLRATEKSEVKFFKLLPLSCGSKHADVYNGNTGYNSNNPNHWCKKLKAMRDKGESTPDKPDVSGGKPKPPVDPGTPDKPDVSGGKPKPPVDPGTPDKPDVSGGKPKPPVDPGTPDKPDVSGGKPKPPVDPGTPDKPDVSGGKPKPPVDPGTPDKPDVSGGKPKPPVDPGTPDKPDVSGGKPKPPVAPAKPDKPDVSGGKPKPPVAPAKPDKPAPGTGAELTSKPDQFKWFSGKTIGFDGVVTPDYQGQAACAATDGVSCLMNVAMKDINFATLKPVKCMVADYNNPQHWCAKVKKHAVFLSLQSREYYARSTIDGSKYVKGYQPVVQGELGSVLALSGSFMDLAADSLSYEYADLEFKKVIASNNAEITSKLAIPASCNPSWVNYASSSVSEVVNNIEATSDICAQEFFKVARLQLQSPAVANITNLFRSEVVQGVVTRLEVYLNNWDGVIKNKEIYNLIVYLRSYKYVAFYNPFVLANPALETKITALFSRGFTYGNGFFGMDAKLEKIRTNSLQSRILYELIMAQGNYNSWNADGIVYITRVIREFSPTVFNTLSMSERTSVARILSSIFASLYYDTSIKGKIENSFAFRSVYTRLVAELVDYSLNSWVASYPNMVLNAGREALRYPLASSKRSAFYNYYRKYSSNTNPTNRPELYAIFAKAVLDVGVCSNAGVCNSRKRLINSVFASSYHCPTAFVDFYYGTGSTQGEMKQLCMDFTTTLASFKTKLIVSEAVDSSDIKEPILKMYVYNKASDWRTYGKSLFDLGTNSPGAFVDNYKKSKAPEAHIFRTGSDLTFGKAPFWNAVHEYTNFLVSKYITKGGSAELTMTQVKGLLWFEEGVAEYFHSDLYHGRDIVASSASGYLPWFKKAKADYFSLIDIIAGYSDHPYSDGYTAVKYLLEEHSDEFYRLTVYLQGGSYDEFASTADELSTLYNYEFDAWLANEGK